VAPRREAVDLPGPDGSRIQFDTNIDFSMLSDDELRTV
jgi:hypothetical protein